MTMQRVMAELSLREFLAICASLDEKYGERVAAATNTGSGWGDNKFVVGEHVKQVRFDVLEIERLSKYLRVKVDIGIERVDLTWGTKKEAA